jgi:nucleotide-binding universal stress UspA family protein
MARIVVGIDGSDSSKEALRWALEEARLRGASLRVVHTWLYPATAYGYAGLLVDPQDLDAAAKQLLDTTVDEVVDGAAGVEIERKAVQGIAAQTLVDEADDADLLVVGSRGHGGFAGLLLGSVSQQCAQHGPCPVVVVRSTADAA